MEANNQERFNSPLGLHFPEARGPESSYLHPQAHHILAMTALRILRNVLAFLLQNEYRSHLATFSELLRIEEKKHRGPRGKSPFLAHRNPKALSRSKQQLLCGFSSPLLSEGHVQKATMSMCLAQTPQKNYESLRQRESSRI